MEYHQNVLVLKYFPVLIHSVYLDFIRFFGLFSPLYFIIPFFNFLDFYLFICCYCMCHYDHHHLHHHYQHYFLLGVHLLRFLTCLTVIYCVCVGHVLFIS